MPYRTAVSAVDEQRFREMLDDRGLLRHGVLASPDRSAAYTVFVQRDHAILDIAGLKTHAARFFTTKLGLTVDKTYVDAPPEIDAARVVLASDDGTASGTRLCFARRTHPSDLAAAEQAERAQQTHGMAHLAQRCPMVWLIVRESASDRVALTLAAILASALLGPILSPEGDELFGVRTARMKLEGRARPYR
jgi:hypothetical protein